MNNRFKTVVKFGHVNVRSLLPTFADFSTFVINNNFDVLGVSETWLSEDILISSVYQATTSVAVIEPVGVEVSAFTSVTR